MSCFHWLWKDDTAVLSLLFIFPCVAYTAWLLEPRQSYKKKVKNSEVIPNDFEKNSTVIYGNMTSFSKVTKICDSIRTASSGSRFTLEEKDLERLQSLCHLSNLLQSSLRGKSRCLCPCALIWLQTHLIGYKAETHKHITAIRFLCCTCAEAARLLLLFLPPSLDGRSRMETSADWCLSSATLYKDT